MTTQADTGSTPGVVAGAVLQAARTSAGLTPAALAATVGADETAVCAWECGSASLATVPYPQIDRLSAALRAAGADHQLVADLDAALWCDLVIGAVAGDGDDDLACLLADPIACGEVFGEMLIWALIGSVPSRYRQYAADGPLYDIPNANLAAGVAQILDIVRRLRRSVTAY
jgi:transcriptional regulator with XRE-family HTH domain